MIESTSETGLSPFLASSSARGTASRRFAEADAAAVVCSTKSPSCSGSDGGSISSLEPKRTLRPPWPALVWTARARNESTSVAGSSLAFRLLAWEAAAELIDALSEGANALVPLPHQRGLRRKLVAPFQSTSSSSERLTTPALSKKRTTRSLNGVPAFAASNLVTPRRGRLVPRRLA